MKKKLLFNLLLLISSYGFAQTYNMTTPEGFGAATTGGGDGSPIILVDNYQDFKDALGLSSPRTIIVKGTITIPEYQSISKRVVNKTILGLPGATLENMSQTQSGSGILNLSNGSENVIIRNLTFKGPGAYDVDGRDLLTSEGCNNLWVDHCEFQDGLDGNFDIKNTTDNVTVSWCKFTYLLPPKAGGSGGSNDHRFSNLVGSSKTNAPADGHFSVTFQNCYWADGCKDRMPRARNAELHILNCYYNTSVDNANAIGLGGGPNNTTCYVENTNFDNIESIFKSYNGSDGGVVYLQFENCLNGINNIGSVDKPSYEYTTYNVEDVKDAVTSESCGAGATLIIDEAGTISSSCDKLSIEDNAIFAVKFYPTVFSESLFFELPTSFTGKTVISIYSVTGKRVFEFTSQHSTHEPQELQLGQLNSGMYFCKVQNGNQSKVYKVIKK
ncbi:T9SS type A sorting domain-containing protein [Formosa sp. S-31]|uniref:pectate lyase family protein n=1 Tax=Formosa sp. S-31 TaxID=2790949 RepID=UPI003EBAAD06